MNSGKTQTFGKNRCNIVGIRWERALRRAVQAVSRPALAIAFLSALLVMAVTPAQAQTLTVLHGFGGPDGANSEASLIRDTQGNLYGTTYNGGTHGYGTVFMVSPSGVEKTLYSFAGGLDGANPMGSLVRDSNGNLYGTTIGGGVKGMGTVFMVTRSGKETLLHTFSGKDGAYPCSNLIQDAQGNFYGTTEFGGLNSAGTVFKLTLSGIETVLYNFTGGADGFEPYAGLVQDAQGNLYGTTLQGGAYTDGTVFKLTLAGIETVLYNFTGGADGFEPYGGLVQDTLGNLYGTTYSGGAYGYGTVFELFLSSGILRVFHSFTGTGGDGAVPYAGLIRDANGNLYGTTYYGGTSGFGTVYMLTPPLPIYRVLYSFTAGADGAGPIAGLVRDTQGNLYGTTLWYGANGAGTVFKLAP
jgi:uncharacterized repeat protein (TIGR03803 family)